MITATAGPPGMCSSSLKARPDTGRGSDDVKEVVRDPQHRGGATGAARADVVRGGSPRRDGLECRGVFAQVLELERGHRRRGGAPVVPAPADPLHAVGRRVGERPQQYGLDKAERSCVRADAQRERQDRDGGERGLPAEGAQRIAAVLSGVCEPGEAACPTMRLAQLLHASERSPRFPPCFVRAEPALAQALLHQRQVQCDLLIQRDVVTATADESGEFRDHLAQPDRCAHASLLHLLSAASLITRSTTPAICFQPCSSRESLRRPAAVMV